MNTKFLWLFAIILSISVTACNKDIDQPKSVEDIVIADDTASPIVASKGFFVVNEDWFGHDKGTLNYFKKDGSNYTTSYRVYRAANPTESDWLGTTTQHAAIWGDYIYISSKQGNRLVVADAKSLNKKVIITNIGGDGRSFVGADDTKGYVGHSKGIAVFDIATLQISKQIEGVSDQIGTMCFAQGRVFAVSQKSGLLVINTKTDVVEQTISGSYNTLTISKDGNVWIASSSKLMKLNPLTLEKEEFDYQSGVSVGSSWGAWNAGSFCASTQKNVLYWASGGKIVKYDIDTKTTNPAIYTLGKSEDDVQLAFYGAGMRVDPLTDELILTVKHSGWGASGAYNWIYKLDADGNEIVNFKVKGDNGTGASWGGNDESWDGKYFWFPAMPLFEDANKPQILINQILLKVGEEIVIDLNGKIIDYDNMSESMQKTVVFEENDLVTSTFDGNKLSVLAGDKTGKTTCTFTVISNGVRVNKIVSVEVIIK